MSNPLPPRKNAPVLTPRPERVRVLVVMAADGWIEVYAPTTTDVHLVQRLHVSEEVDPNLVDEEMESRMPRPYRELHIPKHLRAQDMCRKITPEMRLQSMQDRYYLDELRSMGAFQSEPQKNADKNDDTEGEKWKITFFSTLFQAEN